MDEIIFLNLFNSTDKIINVNFMEENSFYFKIREAKLIYITFYMSISINIDLTINCSLFVDNKFFGDFTITDKEKELFKKFFSHVSAINGIHIDNKLSIEKFIDYFTNNPFKKYN